MFELALETVEVEVHLSSSRRVPENFMWSASNAGRY